jgi:hypothetical protein
MIWLCFGLFLHIFSICFEYKFVIYMIVLLLIMCFMVFNGWLLICFWCLNTCFLWMKSVCYDLMIIYKNEIYSNACLFRCFCSILKVHIRHFDVEWVFELIRTSYVHVCILIAGYKFWILCILIFTCLLLFLKA